MAKITKTGDKQFSLDLRITDSKKYRYQFSISNTPLKTDQKSIEKNSRKERVVIETDVFEKKKRNELASIYSSVVNRAKHLFEE